VKPQPYRVAWPQQPGITPAANSALGHQMSNIDEMFEILFTELRNLRLGIAGAEAHALVAGPVGATGRDGCDGLDGFGWPGPPGAVGARGLAGVPGLDGLDGLDGIDGFPGPTGATGARGLAGIPGLDGIDGDDDAARGPAGWNTDSTAFTGRPTAPTAAAGTNTTQIATTAFVTTAVTPVVQTTTSTGTQNDFALTTGATLLRCNNASLLTITGMSAGVDGQRVTIESVGAGQVNFTHQDTGSSAANRQINFATSAATPLAPGSGNAVYQYDGTTQRWRLVTHNQGAWISQAYSGSDFTAAGSMTWTVDSGDLSVFKYWLKDTTLLVSVNIGVSTLGGTASAQVNIKVPGGFSFATGSSGRAFATYNESASGTAPGFGYCAFNPAVSATLLRLFKIDSANFVLGTDSFSLFTTMQCEVG